MIYILVRTTFPEEHTKINEFIDSVEYLIETKDNNFGELDWKIDKSLIKIKINSAKIPVDLQKLLDNMGFSAMYEIWNEQDDNVIFVQTLNGTIIEKGYLIKLLAPSHIWKL